MSLLLRFSDAHAQGLPTRFAHHPFKEEDGYALTPHGPVRYRTYTPQDVKNPGGVVLLHGVHHLGIDDPRMWNLARALAGAGVLVMTPELQDLADYRVTAQTIDVIGDSADGAEYAHAAQSGRDGAQLCRRPCAAGGGSQRV